MAGYVFCKGVNAQMIWMWWEVARQKSACVIMSSLASGWEASLKRIAL